MAPFFSKIVDVENKNNSKQNCAHICPARELKLDNAIRR